MCHEQAAARRNLRKFVDSTTVRGISRVFKTDFLVVRVIWILAVVVCASLLIYQVQKVAVLYLKYEYSTVIREDIESDIVSYFACIVYMTHFVSHIATARFCHVVSPL